jgi:hypothetical protein
MLKKLKSAGGGPVFLPTIDKMARFGRKAAAAKKRALNFVGKYSCKKPIIVKSSIADDFTSPFLMSRDHKRKLFLQAHEKKMEQCMMEEEATLLKYHCIPMYGPRALLKCRIYNRMKYYPSFRPYYEERLAQLQAIPASLKYKQRLLEFVDVMNAELDAWTFRPTVVEEGGVVE